MPFKLILKLKVINFSPTSFSKDESEKREEIFKILFNGLEDICKYDDCVFFDGNDTLKLKKISDNSKVLPEQVCHRDLF